jgi:hypothetical protein
MVMLLRKNYIPNNIRLFSAYSALTIFDYSWKRPAAPAEWKDLPGRGKKTPAGLPAERGLAARRREIARGFNRPGKSGTIFL